MKKSCWQTDKMIQFLLGYRKQIQNFKEVMKISRYLINICKILEQGELKKLKINRSKQNLNRSSKY